MVNGYSKDARIPSPPSFKARVHSYHQCAPDCMVVTRAHTREEWVVKWTNCSLVGKQRCTKSREDTYAAELAAKLESRGAFIVKADLRVIKQAFERHFRDVQSSTLTAIVKETV